MFLLLTLSAAYYSFTEFGFRQASSYDEADIWLHRVNFLWPFVFSFLLHYVLVYAGILGGRASLRTYVLIYAPPAAVSALTSTTDQIVGEPVEAYWGWTFEIPDASIAYYLTGVWLIALIAVVVYVLFCHYVKAPDFRSKRQAMLMAGGFGLPLVVWTITEAAITPFDVIVPNVTSPTYAVGLSLIAYAVWRYELFALTPEVAASEIIDTMSDSLVLIDGRGNIAAVNRAAAELSRYKEKELIGRPVETIIPQSTPGSDRFRRVNGHRRIDLESGPLSDKELNLKTRLGYLVPIMLSTSFVEDRDGKPTGVVCAFRDLTQLRQMEQRMQESSRLASIGELAAGVAHEINNPLSIIMGFAELAMRADLPGGVRRDVERIYDNGERASRIVHSLLEFARETEASRRDVELARVVERALQLMSQNLGVNNISVNSEIPEDLPVVTANEDQLLQVTLNILNNAAQAIGGSRKGGEIRIECTRQPGCVQLSVTDDGPGIPSEHLPKILDPFFTTKEVGSGTGLGLSVSYGIVQERGGELWAESTRGTGTTVSFSLPVSEA